MSDDIIVKSAAAASLPAYWIRKLEGEIVKGAP